MLTSMSLSLICELGEGLIVDGFRKCLMHSSSYSWVVAMTHCGIHSECDDDFDFFLTAWVCLLEVIFEF